MGAKQLPPLPDPEGIRWGADGSANESGDYTEEQMLAYGRLCVGSSGVAELLAQLQHVVQWHDQICQDDVERYRAAIAKATGASK